MKILGRLGLRKKTAGIMEDSDYYIASSWQLMRRKFFKHKMAIAGGIVLLILYILAIFAGFFSPNDPFTRFPDYADSPPQSIRIFHEGRLVRPFVYGYTPQVNPRTLRRYYELDRTKTYPIRFFARGHNYKFWGFLRTNIHFMMVKEPGVMFLFGTDQMGRDMYARVIYAARISLSIGLVGVAISFVLGCVIGGVSGYFGGAVDMAVQRIIEFLGGIPKLPLWMALSAAVPTNWPAIRVYFGITVILSIIGWTGLARTVRSKLFQLREEDFALAAKVAGATEMRIIVRHLLPGFMSYLIVRLTLAIPGMILGETGLSFLGLGLQPPTVSWGVLLKNAQNIRTVALHPWLLIPAVFVIITVLCFNFLGDGLRDAADPYKR
jgi:peptide/nickel transport system permease protein